MCAEMSDSYFSACFIPPEHSAKVFEDNQDLRENLTTNQSERYILGYFILHLDIAFSITAMFAYILTYLNLKSHITFLTHI